MQIRKGEKLRGCPQKNFSLEARAVRRTPAGAGLMFLRTSTSEIRALSELLSQQPLSDAVLKTGFFKP